MKPDRRPLKSASPSIDALLKIDPSKIGNAALRLAAEKMKKENEEKESQVALKAFRTASDNLDFALAEYRNQKAKLAKSKSYVKALSAAKDALMADGDLKAYDVALYAANKLK
jgi:hypothetical protein